jgi:hypothetical protein
MWTTNAHPNAAFPTLTPAPFFDAWSNVAGLYRDAAQSSTRQFFLSSARIIQEHTLQAFVAAAQGCTDALAKNAMSVQQQSLERFLDANQKAMGAIAKVFFAQAWTGSMPRAK